MLIGFFIAITLGVLFGICTGLFPGLHANLVSTFLISISPFLLKEFSPIYLAIFIVSLAITHTLVDFIPSIFLGAPDETSFLSVLPGHKLLLRGKGYEATIITLYGALTSLPILLVLTPVFILFLPVIYPYVLRIMPLLLLFFSLFMILTEKNKAFSFIIFLLSGFLGIATLELGKLNSSGIKDPLLPLFTGLFGASSLIISINQKTEIPEQETTKLKNIKLNKKSFFESCFISVLISPLTAFLPGLGASQAATIGTEIKGKDSKNNERDFLFFIGLINPLIMSFSFIGLYSINKTRTGAALAIQKLIPSLNFSDLLIILTTTIISTILAFFVSIVLTKLFAKKINRINYSKLSIYILIILFTSNFLYTGLLGLVVLITSTALGITAILLEVRRTQLMGCLLLPTILYYLL